MRQSIFKNDYKLLRFMSSQPIFHHSFLVYWSQILVKSFSPSFFSLEQILDLTLTSVVILSLTY